MKENRILEHALDNVVVKKPNKRFKKGTTLRQALEIAYMDEWTLKQAQKRLKIPFGFRLYYKTYNYFIARVESVKTE